MKEKVLAAVKAGKEIEEKIANGDLVVEYDPEAPDFERVKKNVK